MLDWLYKNIGYLFLLVLGLLALSLYAVPLSTLGYENIRLLEALNTDEAYFLRYIRAALDEKSFGVIMHNYGYLYFYLGLGPLMLIDNFWAVSDQTIIVSFRLLSFAFFIGTVLATYSLGRYALNERVGLLSGLLVLLISPVAYDSAMEIHPDTAQMFFVTLAFGALYRFYFENRITSLLWAAVLAGFAYSCKYSGLLIAPFIFAVFLLQTKTFSYFSRRYFWSIMGYMVFLVVFVNPFQLAKYLDETLFGTTIYLALWLLFIVTGPYMVYRLRLLIVRKSAEGNEFTKRMDMLYLLAMCFWISFVFTSPGAVYNFTFIDSFQKVIGLAADSPVNSGVNGVSLWVKNLFSAEFTQGWLLPLSTILGLVWVIFYKKGMLRILYPMWLWIFSFLLILMLFVNADYQFYLLPVLPFVVILGMFFWESISAELYKYWSLIPVFMLLIVVSVLIALASLRVEQFKSHERKLEVAGIQVSKWLMNNIGEHDTVLSQYYVYVPPAINSVEFSWTIDTNQIKNPKLKWVIVNNQVNAFTEEKRSEQRMNQATDFAEVHRNDNIVVYKRK